MILKPSVNLGDFLRAVQTCRGEVIFETGEGDELNLKSTLSQFVFASVLAGRLETPPGRVLCREEDLPVLRRFLADGE